MDMEAFNKYAKGILELAIREKELDQFLIGRSVYSLELSDGYGGKVQSATKVMETIYSKFRETKDIKFAEDVYNAMVKVLRNEFYEPYIENLLHDIEYQLYAEKNNLAPFKMDCEFLLKELRNTLERNKERYQKPNPTDGPRGFWGTMEDEEEELEKYGLKIF